MYKYIIFRHSYPFYFLSYSLFFFFLKRVLIYELSLQRPCEYQSRTRQGLAESSSTVTEEAPSTVEVDFRDCRFPTYLIFVRPIFGFL